MIAYLKGTVAAVTESRVILEVNQMGFQIFVSSRDAARMPGRGETIQIYTYMNVREDAIQLFGFLSEDDLEIYKLLLNVSGIGPKAALGVLSVLSADDLRFAVLSDDVKAISKAPGIGSKTAQKLILELKDKLKLEDAFEKRFAHMSEGMTAGAGMSDAKTEAVQALTALGYSSSDALKAVRQCGADDETDTETILKLALKQMAFM